MARATTRRWFRWAVGLTVLAGMIASGRGLQAQTRLSRAHLALNQAIDSYRRADYEVAATFFQQAEANQDDLTANERRDLADGKQRNDIALQGRLKGVDQLRQADEAMKGGRTQEAANLVRDLVTNPFLSAADKQKVKELSDRVRPGAVPTPRVTGSTTTPPLVQARGKLQQARSLLVKGNLDSAEQLAREADKLGAVYSSGEDTPRAVLDDVAKARTAASKSDPRNMVVAARAALERNDFDTAERLARDADKVESRWSMHLFGDSPAKVLKDVQSARAKQAASRPVTPPPATVNSVSNVTPRIETAAKLSTNVARNDILPPPAWPKEDKPRVESTSAIQQVKAEEPAPGPNLPPVKPELKPVTAPTAAATAPKTEAPPKPVASAAPKTEAPPKPVASAAPKTEAPAKPAEAPKPTTTSSNPSDAARQLLKQGRQALQNHDVVRAEQLANQAANLKPGLRFDEDTPAKLLADIKKDRDRALVGPNASVAAKPADKSDATKSSDPRAMLREGRELCNGKKYDQAKDVAQKIKKDHPSMAWGLFEDNPDKLLRDIDDGKAQQGKEESVKLLVEARELMKQGKLAEAESKVYRAERLHGPYKAWELGDRPQKVLGEIEAQKAKNRKTEVPPPPGATAMTSGNNPPRPAVNTPKPELKAPDVKPPVLAAGNTPKPPDLKPMDAKPPVLAAGNTPKPPDLKPAGADMVPPPPPPPLPPFMDPALQQTNAKAVVKEPVPPAPPAPTAPAKPDPAKVAAKAQLAEARQLQKSGRLVEARWKLMAIRGAAAFGPDEDRPEMAMVELAGECEKKIDSLTQKAMDEAARAEKDAKALDRAEQQLLEARQLAAGFGLDHQPIEVKLALVRQKRTPLPPAPVAVAPAPPQPRPEAKTPPPPSMALAPLPPLPPPEAPGTATLPPFQRVGANEPAAAGTATVPPPGTAQVANQADTPQQRGYAILDKARLELRKGQTVTARRMAEEVFTGNFGLQAEAANLLRSIDVEEFNQRVSTANQQFDTGHEAFLRKDYAQARRLFESIDDPKMLKPDKAGKLRELMQLPELQPSAVARRPETPPQPADNGVSTVAQRTPAATNAPVQRPAAAADNYAEQVKALQDIKFQQLQQEAIRIQQVATESIKQGETDRALEMLQEFVYSLEKSNLDANKVALLRRPVEARLQMFQTLKAQRDFESNQRAQRDSGKIAHDRRELAKAEKEKTVADLMKQYNEFYKQGKYDDAGVVAMRAHELDPDNAACDYAVNLARIQARQSRATEAKDSRETAAFQALTDSENFGKTPNDEDPLLYDPQSWERVKNRKDYAKGILNTVRSEKEKAIERRLSQPISLNFYDTPLRQVLNDLHQETGLNIVPDKQALDEKNINLDRPITLEHLEGVMLRSALNILLKQVQLTYVIKDEVLWVTTPEHAKGKQVQKTWPVADLIIPVDNYSVPLNAQLMKVLGQQPQGLSTAGPAGLSPFGLQNGTPVSGAPGTPQPPVGSMASVTTQSIAPGANAPAGTRAPGQTQTMEDMLIKLITNTIQPMSWSEVGGSGTIDYFPFGMALIINQTPDVQEQIQELLDALRRLQDVEIAVEVRMISLEEAFFERIGLDFNINIKTDQNTRKYEPQIVTQQFKPPGYVNDFNPNNFITGLTPAGNWTSDLDIPIRNSSFNMAIPPFGGFPNIPGADGGLSMGLAFLSDIQVFMFMEAAQGDRRTNVMQAPKLTLFNGQTSTIQIQDFQFFVTNVQVVQSSGQIVFIPNNTPMPLGVNLAVQGVVSADRRFVRLNISPTMTNLASATVPLFPITTFITPVFEGGAQGQPIPFTQFIQQPTFTLVNIQTTVSVPDGGTVLLGGLKLLNEGRNEFGPPVLSKIPYVNRLFKNVGYGRDTSSLLLMVTPRIIINLEEEERQTGVVTLPTPGI